MRIILIRFWISVLFLYALALSALLYFQAFFIFAPTHTGERTPKQFNVPYQQVSIPSRNGTLNAWLIQHQQKPNSRVRPLVMYCHGNATTFSRIAHLSKTYYDYGWDVLFFDYRGYGKSSDPQEGLSQDSVIHDADTAWHWLRTHYPSRPITLWGHSLGSSVCAHIGKRHHAASMILEGGFPSIFAMAQYRYPYFPLFPWMVHAPFSTETALQHRRTRFLTVLHADNDKVVPYEMGQRLFAGAPGPKRFVTLEGVGHNAFSDVAVRYGGRLKHRVGRAMRR